MTKIREFLGQHGKTFVYPVLGIALGWLAGTTVLVSDEPAECSEVAESALEGSGDE